MQRHLIKEDHSVYIIDAGNEAINLQKAKQAFGVFGVEI